MKKYACSAFAALLLALPVPANAVEITLTCDMTRYDSGATSGIEALVPRHAVHRLVGTSAEILNTEFVGTADLAGSRITIRYEGSLKNIGEAEVVYTFVKSSGKMIAKTRGFRTKVWFDEDPELTGKHTISGQCTMGK